MRKSYTDSPAYGNANCVAELHARWNARAMPDGNVDTYGNINTNSDCNSNIRGDCNCHGNSHCDCGAEIYADAQAASHASTTPIGSSV